MDNVTTQMGCYPTHPQYPHLTPMHPPGISVIVVDESEEGTVQLKVSLEKDPSQNTGSTKT